MRATSLSDSTCILLQSSYSSVCHPLGAQMIVYKIIKRPLVVVTWRLCSTSRSGFQSVKYSTTIRPEDLSQVFCYGGFSSLRLSYTPSGLDYDLSLTKPKDSKAIKPRGCQSCDRSFLREKSLGQHSRDMHPGLPVADAATPKENSYVKPYYGCQSCIQTFATTDGLIHHL